MGHFYNFNYFCVFHSAARTNTAKLLLLIDKYQLPTYPVYRMCLGSRMAALNIPLPVGWLTCSSGNRISVWPDWVILKFLEKYFFQK